MIEKTKRFISIGDLSERWGCSNMSIERLIDEDPTFPPVWKLGPRGRRRIIDVDLIEGYEQRSVVTKQATTKRAGRK